MPSKSRYIRSVFKERKSLSKEELEVISRRYRTSADAAQASGMTRQAFNRRCRLLGVATPALRSAALAALRAETTATAEAE